MSRNDKLAARRHWPVAPKGLEDVYAIVLARQKRELRRLHGSTQLECTLAQNQLGSAVAAERKSAAKTLGRLRSIYSFEPLLHALARESEPGDEGRAVKAAMLKALRNIGSDHCGQVALAAGREPLKKFSMAHLDDAGLVRSALKALEYTCLRCEAIEDMENVMKAAAEAGYKDTDLAASGLWLNAVRGS